MILKITTDGKYVIYDEVILPKQMGNGVQARALERDPGHVVPGSQMHKQSRKQHRRLHLRSNCMLQRLSVE